MNISWNISKKDIRNLSEFVKQQNNSFVENRIERNVYRQNIHIDRDAILKCMLMCLLITQKRSGPNGLIDVFLGQKPFPLTYQVISQIEDVEDYVRQVLQQNGLQRYLNKISKYFALNVSFLEDTNWNLCVDLENMLDKEASKQTERMVADNIDQAFKGFGSQQARKFLQTLGLTKYEIPIDSRMMDWLNNFGFPLKLSSIALQDKSFYHFVSDGVQILCERANVYPCVLEAAIVSSKVPPKIKRAL